MAALRLAMEMLVQDLSRSVFSPRCYIANAFLLQIQAELISYNTYCSMLFKYKQGKAM